ncbi:flagellar hook-basal body complex protein FliE [Thiomicrospira sp. ALE5]|uniref:flagellar hook-basal body complex protein FliE n=1 Tax=Thiomicrospira sp. ALE5 TaxID=748650 RepID=UPI0008E45476|nr:flagellar hook-basal body complex protein FliE [Thiomicrospira sp. ALE5]SFR59290.1 flagellar hook-basal body complex protein FliE [Thiomicrospira sp. ALE5]
MDKVDTQSLLLQMQALSAQAQNKPQDISAASSADAAGFGQMLQESLAAVNSQAQQTEQMREALVTGDPSADLTEVMLQAQKASLSFEAMTQVRNKLVEAYKDVMNMPI